MRVDYCPMGFPIGGVIYTVIALRINACALPIIVVIHELVLGSMKWFLQ